MNLKTFLSDLNFTRVALVTSVAVNALLGATLFYATGRLVNHHDRVVLVPPSLDHEAQIAWDSANQEYIKSFALYMATLVGNIQPRTSATVLDSVSIFLKPSIYSAVRTQLLEVINDPVFQASGSTFSFIPQAIRYEPETRRAFVSGQITTLTASGEKYIKSVTYEMTVQIREGRPYVLHFTSYEGLNARTALWWQREAQKKKMDVPAYAVPRAHMLASDKDDNTGDSDSEVIFAPEPDTAEAVAAGVHNTASVVPTEADTEDTDPHGRPSWEQAGGEP